MAIRRLGFYEMMPSSPLWTRVPMEREMEGGGHEPSATNVVIIATQGKRGGGEGK